MSPEPQVSVRRGAASLDLQNLRQTFGATLAVDDVSLRVEPGEIVCLLGHSGCGKTSLLRIVAGLERPDSGRVLIDGREVVGPDRFTPPEQRGVGMMFQDYALFPHLTIFENVTFGLSKLPAHKARIVAEAQLARVGLLRYSKDYPHMLSGGEQQRVALARAMAPHPGVLLMDEPFSNLDQRMRERIREETASLLREKGATAVVVTHDPEEAMQLADRIALMRAGKIVQMGTAEELYEAPQSLFAARFFCDLNEIDAVALNGRIQTPLGDFDAPAEVEDGPVTLCLRPHGIKLEPFDPSAPPPLTGVLTNRRYLGEDDLRHVQVAGLVAPLRVRGAARWRPEIGESAGLRIDPRQVLVFSRKSV
jgi:iron(III) transport system ATP-binding protein